jgi:redox-sensing transcriptional repressor
LSNLSHSPNRWLPVNLDGMSPTSRPRNSRSGPVPAATVSRLTLYLRELGDLAEKGEETISSSRLADRLGITSASVRSDFQFIGVSGVSGRGYNVRNLIEQIKDSLGLSLVQRTIVVGMGNLGRALISYPGFQSRGFEIVAAFDTDPRKIGVRVGHRVVQSLEELESVVKTQKVSLAMLAVPAEVALEVAKQLWSAGVSGILNFAPTSLGEGEYVNVDVAAELQQLSFRTRSKAAARAAE